MALITKDYTFSTGATILASEHNTNFDTLFNAFNGNIDNANIKSGAAISLSKLSLSDDITMTGDWNFTSAATTDDMLTLTGSSLTTGSALKVYSNSSSTSTRNLVEIINDHSDADATTCLQIQQDGDAAHINLTGDSSNTTPVDGDIWYDGTDIKLYDGTSNRILSASTSQVTGATDITSAGTSYADMTDMVLTFTGAGTYLIQFEAPIKLSSSGSSSVSIALDIDGSDVVERVYGAYSIGGENPVGKIHTAITWVATITTETTAKIQWKHAVAAATQYGTESKRVFSFVKIA